LSLIDSLWELAHSAVRGERKKRGAVHDRTPYKGRKEGRVGAVLGCTKGGRKGKCVLELQGAKSPRSKKRGGKREGKVTSVISTGGGRERKISPDQIIEGKKEDNLTLFDSSSFGNKPSLSTRERKENARILEEKGIAPVLINSSGREGKAGGENKLGLRFPSKGKSGYPLLGEEKASATGHEGRKGGGEGHKKVTGCSRKGEKSI